MGVLLNGSGQYLQRTANLPTSTAWTLAGWVKLGSGPNSGIEWYAIAILCLADDSAWQQLVQVDWSDPAGMSFGHSNTGGSGFITISTMNGVCMVADTNIAANAVGLFLMHGFARDDSWNWNVGGSSGLIYGSTAGTTGNTLTQTAPTGANAVTQILGVATHPDRIYFNPQLVQVEHV